MTDERRDVGLPDRRANTYEALEKHLDEHIEKIENQFSRWLKRGLVAFGIIGLACTIALIGFGITLHEVKQTRKDFTRVACESQNTRHNNTVEKFFVVAAEAIEKHPEQATAVKESTDANLALISTLQPLQDCEYLVKLSVGDIEPTASPKPTPTKTPTPAKTP